MASNAGNGQADIYQRLVSATQPASTASGPAMAASAPAHPGGWPGATRRLQQGAAGTLGPTDDRYEGDTAIHHFPFSTVGFLSLGNSTYSGCTGTLVGRRSVLTTANCEQGRRCSAAGRLDRWMQRPPSQPPIPLLPSLAVFSSGLKKIFAGKWYNPTFWPNIHGGGQSHCHSGTTSSRRCYTRKSVSWSNMVRQPRGPAFRATAGSMWRQGGIGLHPFAQQHDRLL